MPAERFFLAKTLSPGATEILEGQEFHHLFHVMRAKMGESLEIINGKGILAQAHIHELHKKFAVVKIDSIHKEKLPHPKIILAQAIPRINRLDFIVEKCTELGMYELWLFPGQNSERKDLTDHQLDRLKNLTIAACKQSGRLWLPEIYVKPKLNEWQHVGLQGFFGDVSPHAEFLSEALKKNCFQDAIIFFTGPESGFTTQEEGHLKQLGMQGVKLHHSILRTDTASIMALSTLIAFSQIDTS